ncbi:MAG: SWIM zinc finger family protein [Roseiflexaceae bacterium]
MPTTLTPEQVLALAPDPASAKAGRSLATPRSWISSGQHDDAVWGECQGSGKDPYRTQIDLRDLAFRCSCPSRKFPCKHGLGLLLMLAERPASIAAADPPAWVAEWLDSRNKRAAQQAERKAQAAEHAEDPALQQRRAQQQARTASAREAKVAAGLQELGQWLRDQIRQGLALTQQQAPASFERMAARMVDAQAPGLARRLRDAASIPARGGNWQELLLEQLALLELICQGYQRIETLSAAEQADLRSAIGFTLPQEAVLAEPPFHDQWLVLGQQLETQDHLRVARSWLWGSQSQRLALLLDFAAGAQPLERSVVPGTTLAADLCFFPSAAPLRALIHTRHSATPPMPILPEQPIDSLYQHYATWIGQLPWIDQIATALGPVTLARQDDRWLLCDPTGKQLPLHPQFARGWHLLAQTGGAPCWMVVEWDGRMAQPLAAFLGTQFISLATSGSDSVAGGS